MGVRFGKPERFLLNESCGSTNRAEAAKPPRAFVDTVFSTVEDLRGQVRECLLLLLLLLLLDPTARVAEGAGASGSEPRKGVLMRDGRGAGRR